MCVLVYINVCICMYVLVCCMYALVWKNSLAKYWS